MEFEKTGSGTGERGPSTVQKTVPRGGIKSKGRGEEV